MVAKRSYAEKNPDLVKRFIKSLAEAMKRLHDDKDFAMNSLGQYTKVTDPKMLEESYRFGIDSFFKDFKTPPDGIRLMVDQLASSRMIDAAGAENSAHGVL